jgi:hypothetical protein
MWETKSHEKYWDGNKDKTKDANEMTQQSWTETEWNHHILWDITLYK